jgi:cytochrome b6-f complex iron-sulfur subunit
MKKLTRREFLRLATNSLLGLSGALGFLGIIRFLSFEMDPALPSQYDLGSADSYLPGSRTLLKQIPAVLIRNGAEFMAFSLICTHLGCTVEQKGNDFECPCHGSKYNSQGYVTRGPSNKSLRRLRVEINEAGNLILYMNA